MENNEGERSPEVPAKRINRGYFSKRSTIVFTVVVLFCIGLLALLSVLLLTPSDPSAAGHSPDSTGMLTYNGPLIGKPAPDFTLNTLGASTPGKLTLAKFKGHPIILNMWASWCGPCQDEAPLFENAWKQNQAKGLVIIGINGQEAQPQDGLGFIQKYGLTYQNVSDTSGSVAINYGATYMPHTIFIDRKGNIAFIVPGQITDQKLQQYLTRIMAS